MIDYEKVRKILQSQCRRQNKPGIPCTVCKKDIYPKTDKNGCYVETPPGSYQYIKTRSGNEYFIHNNCFKKLNEVKI